jgi:hypothetical protein
MVSTVNLTSNELIALKSITYSDFYENGRESVVWDFSVYDDCPLKGKTKSGTFSSLVQKGLVFTQEAEKKYITDNQGNKVINKFWSRDCNFGTLYITEAGYQLLDQLQLIDENGRFI